MTQQADLEQERASRPAAGAAAPAETIDSAPQREEKGKATVVGGSPDFRLNVPFYIHPTTDVEMIDRVFAAVAQHHFSLNLQIHIDASSSQELIEHIAASMERHFYGDRA